MRVGELEHKEFLELDPEGAVIRLVGQRVLLLRSSTRSAIGTRSRSRRSTSRSRSASPRTTSRWAGTGPSISRSSTPSAPPTASLTTATRSGSSRRPRSAARSARSISTAPSRSGLTSMEGAAPPMRFSNLSACPRALRSASKLTFPEGGALTLAAPHLTRPSRSQRGCRGSRLQTPGFRKNSSWSLGSGARSLCHPAQDLAPKGLSTINHRREAAPQPTPPRLGSEAQPRWQPLPALLASPKSPRSLGAA
jgi:hypothetical protein